MEVSLECWRGTEQIKSEHALVTLIKYNSSVLKLQINSSCSNFFFWYIGLRLSSFFKGQVWNLQKAFWNQQKALQRVVAFAIGGIPWGIHICRFTLSFCVRESCILCDSLDCVSQRHIRYFVNILCGDHCWTNTHFWNSFS